MGSYFSYIRFLPAPAIRIPNYSLNFLMPSTSVLYALLYDRKWLFVSPGSELFDKNQYHKPIFVSLLRNGMFLLMYCRNFRKKNASRCNGGFFNSWGLKNCLFRLLSIPIWGTSTTSLCIGQFSEEFNRSQIRSRPNCGNRSSIRGRGEDSTWTAIFYAY